MALGKHLSQRSIKKHSLSPQNKVKNLVLKTIKCVFKFVNKHIATFMAMKVTRYTTETSATAMI
ncbi:hypothetical protein H5410_053121 [Solanum commersonii]|uniref:Uncharacterized protein n=1 Tax=Solanum commersonii TaxID=4109 RepID=A0A9J5X5I3_SOLCO|nr:hypothetical protein H5410_053121 [Solanum commersonii]